MSSRHINLDRRRLSFIDVEQEMVAFLGTGPSIQQLHPSRTRCAVWPWIGSTLLFAILFFVVLATSYRKAPYGTFEGGFSTELAQAARLVRLQQVKFTGTLFYDENGALHRSVDNEQPKYVGPPSPELDANWEFLIRNRYVHFLGNDTSISLDLRSEAFHDPQRGGMYVIGIDAFHTLHCINMLRMAIDHEYYHDKWLESEYNARLHVEHCLDYLRQMVECKADLTPLPVYFSPGGNRMVPDFDRVHLCRDTRKLREWMDRKTLSALKLGPVWM